MTEAPAWRLLVGDARERLAELEAGSVHTVVTSPPYFGLRDYGTGEWEGGDPACDHRHETAHQQQGATSLRAGRSNVEAQRNENFRETCGKCGARRVDRQIGLEPTPDEFVAALVAVFRGVRRVLRDDGTVWLNLGDSYAANAGTGHNGRHPNGDTWGGTSVDKRGAAKPKDLLGVPWMVAFALRADGWYLRSEIIWAKRNCMPESVTDRPTRAHEQIFLLSKSPRYFFDSDAIREEDAGTDHPRAVLDGQPSLEPSGGLASAHKGIRTTDGRNGAGRNKRSVWHVATAPFSGSHFATFPPKLIEPCILAGAPERACGVCGAPWVRVVEREATTSDGRRRPSPVGAKHDDVPLAHRADGHERLVGALAYEVHTLGFEPSCSHDDGSAAGVVLDPFAGAGTTGLVALQHRREFVGIELNPEYAGMARDRIETAVRLGFRAPERGPDVPADQGALFEL